MRTQSFFLFPVSDTGGRQPANHFMYLCPFCRLVTPLSFLSVR
uniref:Uncharacterized protein n=1 Tax=Faecalibaculum rodentium TaxID=1702221 RepID=A0A140DXH3_9FIRM|nr:hypothetical protein AALO17_22160 [Faecalibaculum rodentium]